MWVDLVGFSQIPNNVKSNKTNSMRKIRIGKDIAIRWAILTNGSAESLVGRDLKLHVASSFHAPRELPISICADTPNVLESVFRGVDQKKTGKYRLTLWENFGKDGQTAVDCCDAFTLVDTTCEEADGDSGNLETETIDLSTGNLQVLSGSVPEAPMDGCHYGRRDGSWGKVVGSASIRDMVVLTQQEYDEMDAHDEQTLYIIR